MKQNVLTLLLLLGSTSLLMAQAPAGYYTTANGLSGTALHQALHDIIDNHTEYPYTSSSTDTWDILEVSDEDPSNSANVLLVYTANSVNGAAQFPTWNREHVWPQSLVWNNGTQTGAGTDVHNLKPADPGTNSSRSNKEYDNGGSPVSGVSNTFADSDSWEPRDAVKGDVARIIFYMAVRYEGDVSGEPNLVLDDFTDGGMGTFGKLSTLLTWHQNDPVDQYERNRNNAIYGYQGNRNPFIDNPQYANDIWGSGAGISGNQVYLLDFESNGGYATSEPEFVNSTNDYFSRTNGGNVNTGFSNLQGSYYFAAQDIDDQSSVTLPVTLNIDNIDISNFTNLELRIFLAEDDAPSGEDWDSGDYVHISYQIDNTGGFSDLLNFENDGNTFNTVASLDTNFDGNGDGVQVLTDAFTQFSGAIAGTGSQLDIEIEFNLNSEDEDIAIDHIQIIGDPPGPTISLNSPSQIGAASVEEQSANHLITAFELSTTNASTDLQSLTLPTSGSFQAGDIDQFTLWHSANASFDSTADTPLATFFNPAAAGSQQFTGFTQNLPDGGTEYFFVTAHFPCGATAGNTISVDALNNTHFGFSNSVTVNGTAASAGTQTIVDQTPGNVSNLAATDENAQSGLSWSNPDCYDEVVVVAHTSPINGTPSGGYAAASSNFQDGNNPTFPGGGIVVYSDTGSSVSVGGLTNGTTYYFKVFSRNGAHYNSGTQTTADPAQPSGSIYLLDFESAGGYTTSVTEFSDGSEDYFTRTDGTNISGAVSFSQKLGSYYFAAQDIDGEGANPLQTLTINNIAIEGYRNLEFRVYLAEDDDGSNEDWDRADDYLHISYRIDNGGFQNLLWVENDNSTYNSAPFIDTDFDGIGDGTEITDSFQQFTRSISGTGDDLDLAFEFNFDSGDEDIAIDHIEIYGDVDPATTFTYQNGSWQPFHPAGTATSFNDLRIIDGRVSISSNTNCDNLTLEPGAALTIANGVSISASGVVHLKADDSKYAQLIGEVIAPDFEIETVFDATEARWFNLANPHAGGTVADFSVSDGSIITSATGTAGQVNIWYYDPATLDGSTSEGTWTRVPNAAESTDGKAFSLFLGPPYFGTFPITVTATGSSLANGSRNVVLDNSNGGWNFVPNPYPSALDWNSYRDANTTNLNATYYVDNAGTFASYDASADAAANGGDAFVAPMQGFFVQATGAATLAFTNTHRSVANSPNKLKSSATLVKLKSSSNATQGSDESVIVFGSQYSDGLDVNLDAEKRMNYAAGVPNLFTTDSLGHQFVYNKLNNQFTEKVVALSFENDTAGLHSIDISDNRLPADWSVTLVDKLNGNRFDLLSGSYQFAHNLSNRADRFELIFKQQVVGQDEVNTANIYAYLLDGELAVNLENWNGQASVSLYDMQGRLISTSDAEGGSTFRTDLSSLAQGLYLVKVTAGERPLHTQKIIK